jgi:hypothetical protein
MLEDMDGLVPGHCVPQGFDRFTPHVDVGMRPRQLDQGIDAALVLEVAERLDRFALDVGVAVASGDLAQRLARRTLGAGPQRLDGLTARVAVRERPGERNQDRRGLAPAVRSPIRG